MRRTCREILNTEKLIQARHEYFFDGFGMIDVIRALLIKATCSCSQCSYYVVFGPDVAGGFINIKGLNKRSRLPRRQTLAVGMFPLGRSQLTLA